MKLFNILLLSYYLLNVFCIKENDEKPLRFLRFGFGGPFAGTSGNAGVLSRLGKRRLQTDDKIDVICYEPAEKYYFCVKDTNITES